MLKAVKDTWQNAFERNLDNAERASVRDFTNYYKTETNKAIGVMLQKNSITEQDLLGVFTLDGFGKLYEGLYERIGMTFANWYAKNFDKYITKGVSANQFQEPWRASFRNQGILVGAQRVTLVQNTAKATLIKVYRQLANDPVFASEGEVVRAKMLRQQFDRYSKYQAERLVRTEATNAANYATMQSAQDIFPGADMQKEWISASDERTRAAHREANGQIVDFNKPFIVKGEELMRPGDPSGSASNVVNCRCSMAPFPKEAAQTIGLIEDIGFGLNTTLTDETLMSLSPGTQAAVNTIIVEEVAELQAKTIKQAKENASKILLDNGIKTKSVASARVVDLDLFNAYNTQLSRLTKEYNIKHKRNLNSVADIKFQEKAGYYGRVSRSGYDFSLVEINFGSTTDAIKNRTRFDNLAEFSRMPKSAISPANQKIATLTHEFAHVISNSRFAARDGFHKEFWDELTNIRRSYWNEINAYKTSGNIKKFNEIYLGDYADANINEFFAEAFTEYKLNSNPSKYAKLAGELIDRYFKN
jgi:hypothetical protein